MTNKTTGILCSDVEAIQKYNEYVQTPCTSKMRLVVIAEANGRKIQWWDVEKIGFIEKFTAVVGLGRTYNLKIVAETIIAKQSGIASQDAEAYITFAKNVDAYLAQKVAQAYQKYPKDKGLKDYEEWIGKTRHELSCFTKELQNKYGIAQMGVENSITKKALIGMPGIKNAGNSCYMNCALQGLLVSPVVVLRIKKYDQYPIPNNELFIPTLQKFVRFYEEYIKNPSYAYADTIGACASELRIKMYRARLHSLGVERVDAMADADLVVMILGSVLQIEYPFITRFIASQGKTDQGKVITDIVTDVLSNRLIWPEVKTSGEPSLEKTIGWQCTVGKKEDLKEPWKTDIMHENQSISVTIKRRKELYRLVGDPPPLLVFRVGTSKGEMMDAPFKPYQVKPRDEFLDISKAYDIKPTNGAIYRLIAILENHGRVHWTAKIRAQDSWYDCNDDIVKKLGQEVPHASAAIMIYELAG